MVMLRGSAAGVFDIRHDGFYAYAYAAALAL
jgi:hypothetical protein